MKLVILYGLPGVGKLTVARELGKRTRFPVFHNHLAVDLVESVFEFGSQPFIELRAKIWLVVFAEAAAAHLDGLIFTLASDSSVNDSFIDDVKRLVESDGGEVLFVELQCSPKELEKRIVNPSRERFGKLSSVERFRELKAGGAFTGPSIRADRFLLDTTVLSASDAAEVISESVSWQ